MRSAPAPPTAPYGIHVAKLAGLPKSVTARAEEVLSVLEKGEQGGALTRLAEDLPLFSAARRRAEPAPRESEAEALLRDNPPRRTHSARSARTGLPAQWTALEIGRYAAAGNSRYNLRLQIVRGSSAVILQIEVADLAFAHLLRVR
jgi:hypothetical protein